VITPPPAPAASIEFTPILAIGTACCTLGTASSGKGTAEETSGNDESYGGSELVAFAPVFFTLLALDLP